MLRPSFAALVAAEEELGPLFALVERAAEGELALSEIAALFDHLSRGAAGGDHARADRRGDRRAGAGRGERRCCELVLGQILQGR